MEQKMRYGRSGVAGYVADILRLGLPLIGAQLAQLAINATDVVVVGHLGELDLAGIVLATQYFFLVLFFGSGFPTALMPLISHAVGRDDPEEVRRVLQMGMWISMAFAAVCLPLFLYSEPILIWMGQKPDVSAKAGQYLQILGFGVGPALAFQVLKSFLSALGRTRIIFYVNFVCIAFNAILAYTFTLGHFGVPSYGLEAAAFIAVGIELLFAVSLMIYIAIVPATRQYGLLRDVFRQDWRAFLEVIRHGVPISLMILSEMSLFSVAAIMVGWLGSLQLAAHGVAMQYAAISFMVPLGLSQAATVIVGISAARGDREAVKNAGIAALLMACASSVISGAVLIAAARPLASLFVDTDTPGAAAVIEYAVPFITVAGIFQLFDGLQTVGAGLARGLKDSTVPMVLAMVSYWIVGFGCAYLLAFPLHFGGLGIWAGFVAGLVAAAILLNMRFAYLVGRMRDGNGGSAKP
jgi:multidrug resistance protein, MATE family